MQTMTSPIEVTLFHADTKVDLSFNGKYVAVLERTVNRLQMFHIHNHNLKGQASDTPAALFLHPLGSISKLYDVASSDVCWHLDALEYADV